MMSKINLRKLSQKDISELYDFLLFFEKTAIMNYGKFNWEWIRTHKYISSNDIQIKCTTKNHKANYFRFCTDKINGINDYAYHFMRHIRNAFAHGNIGKCGANTFIINDFKKKKDGTFETTMTAKIDAKYFWQIIDIIKNSLNK